MKSLKITTIIIAIIATFASCKKESALKQANNNTKLVSYKDKSLKMTFDGKQYEYNISYDDKENSTNFAGKDASEVVSIIGKYNEFVALFTSENEFIFFRNKNDYYSLVFKNMLESNLVKPKDNNTNVRHSITSISNTVSANILLQSTLIEFYKDRNFGGGILKTDAVGNYTGWFNSTYTGLELYPYPSLVFNFYQRLNDGTDNFFQTANAISAPGIKNANVGTAANDQFSSFKTSNTINSYANPTPNINFNGTYITYNKMNVILFEHANFGGRAIAYNCGLGKADLINELSLATKLSFFKITNSPINNVPTTLINTNNWNDRVSSYQLYYSF